MIDRYNTPITEGAVVTYPIRSGSFMTCVTAVVCDVFEDTDDMAGYIRVRPVSSGSWKYGDAYLKKQHLTPVRDLGRVTVLPHKTASRDAEGKFIIA